MPHLRSAAVAACLQLLSLKDLVGVLIPLSVLSLIFCLSSSSSFGWSASRDVTSSRPPRFLQLVCIFCLFVFLFLFFFFPICLVTPGCQDIKFLCIFEYKGDFKGGWQAFLLQLLYQEIPVYSNASLNPSFLSREEDEFKHWSTEKIHICILWFQAIFHF